MAGPDDGWEDVTDPTEVPADVRKTIGVAGMRSALGVSSGSGDSGKAIPQWAEKKYSPQIETYAGLSSSLNGFKDEYAGNTLTGGLENSIQGVYSGFGSEGQRDWWATFKSNDNQIRNKLFGSALTDTEKTAYEATTINPSMDPKEIRRNLTTRRGIVQKALQRSTKFLQAQGYNPESIAALAGEYAPDLGAVPTQQAKGGDPASTVAGAVADGSGAPPPPGSPPPQNRDAGGTVQFAGEGPQMQANAMQLTDEQWQTFQQAAMSGASAEKLAGIATAFGRSPDAEGMKNIEGIATYYANPANRKTPLGVSYTRDEVKPVDAGDGAAGAAARGAGNVFTIGGLDEVGALADTVTTGGTYAENLDTRRGQELFDEQQHGTARLLGQVVAGLPVGGIEFMGARAASRVAGIAAVRAGRGADEARTIANRVFALRTAGDSAIFGGASGFGNAEGDLGDRAVGGAIGAGIGGALGGVTALAGGRFARALASRRGGPPTPPRPSAVAYKEGQDLGIDLPLGATGNRAGAIADQTLSNMTGSANVMQAAGAETRKQVEGAVRKVASNYGTAGGTFYSIGESAQRGAKTWIDRFHRVASKAYDAIPISQNAPTLTNNSTAILDTVLSRFSSNPKLASMFKSGELQGYKDALADKTSWQDLKDFRSVIGEKIGEFRFGDGAAKSDLRALYAGLSDDMKQSASAQGPRALAAFERANNLYAAGQQRIEGALTRILGDDGKQSAEKAGAFIDRIAQGNKGSADVKLLAEVQKSLPAAEWGEVAGSLISIMGQPANSQGRAFAADTFARRFGDMSDDARKALFGSGPARDELNKFVRVSEGLARAASVRNTSNTAGQVLTGLAFYSVGNLPAVLGQAATSFLGAKMMTNPSFVRWATGYNKMLRAAVTTGNAPKSSAINSQIAFLGRVARAEPAIANEVLAIQQRLTDAFAQGGGAMPARLAAQEPTSERLDRGAPVQRQDSQGATANQRLQP